MNSKLQSLYRLKFNPFRPDVPVEALYTTPTVDAFLPRRDRHRRRRVRHDLMITGDPAPERASRSPPR